MCAFAAMVWAVRQLIRPHQPACTLTAPSPGTEAHPTLTSAISCQDYQLCARQSQFQPFLNALDGGSVCGYRDFSLRRRHGSPGYDPAVALQDRIFIHRRARGECPLLPRTVSGTVPGMHAHYSFLTGLACRSARWEAGTRPASTGRLLSCRSRVHRLFPSVPAPARPLSSRRAAVRSPKPATLPRRRSPARDRHSSSR